MKNVRDFSRSWKKHFLFVFGEGVSVQKKLTLRDENQSFKVLCENEIGYLMICALDENGHNREYSGFVLLSGGILHLEFFSGAKFQVQPWGNAPLYDWYRTSGGGWHKVRGDAR